ncbi:MAG: hypothetical protein BMS9Abin02_1327 [Anaerolineae bacterium]|nr:MAG: hypothetical protein BMS9Abin02_1327 [Anaerolineae bacterium]
MWLSNLAVSMSLWPVNLLRDGPKRVGRLIAVLSINPEVRDLRKFAAWWHRVIVYLFDLIGGPEVIQLVIRMATRTRPLTEKEILAASEVIGAHNLRFNEVRIARDGLWRLIFKYNKQRAFATWHTINLPEAAEDNIPLLVHELVHTYQYERCGSIYIGQGLWAQIRYGRKAYDYGGSQGLSADYAAGKRYSDYNREQQGQIAQDYCSLWLNKQSTTAYEPFIEDLRSGVL